jgi:predicted dehydrogenase
VNRLRIAVIGGGHLGRIHTRLLRTHPLVEFMGVVDPSAEARQKVSTEFGVATFAHHHEVTGHIDAAVVATTTGTHHPVGCDLLSRGIHIFVEKPLTTSTVLADEMIALARRHGLVLQVGHVERFNPAWRAVAHHLHRPRFIDSVRTSGYTFRSTDIGVVLDLMIHDLDLVLSMVRSDLADIDAVGATLFGPCEDLAHAHLRFANGCVANLNASRTSFQAQRTMQVLTDRAYVGIDFAASTARMVRPHKELVRGRMNIHELSREQKEHLKTNLFTELLPLEEVPVTPGNAIQEEQIEFVSCIVERRTPSVSGDHARSCLAVAEQILDRIKQPRLRRSPQLVTPSGWHLPPQDPSASPHRRAS